LLQRNFELILLSPVKKEMELLVLNRSPKLRKTARFALQLAENVDVLQLRLLPLLLLMTLLLE